MKGLFSRRLTERAHLGRSQSFCSVTTEVGRLDGRGRDQAQARSRSGAPLAVRPSPIVRDLVELLPRPFDPYPELQEYAHRCRHTTPWNPGNVAANSPSQRSSELSPSGTVCLT